MSELSIEVPEDLKKFAEEEAGKSGFKSVSAYLASLLRNAADRNRAKASLEAELLSGLDSPTQEADPTYWHKLRERAKNGPP